MIPSALACGARTCLVSTAGAVNFQLYTSAEEREQEERVGIEPGAFRQQAGFLHELLGTGAVAAIQVDRGQAVVAGEDQLRLADPLGERERLTVGVIRFLELSAALMDLRHDDQRNGEVVQLPEVAVERDGGH